MHKICTLAAVAEGQAAGFHVDGRALIVVRQQGCFHVYENRCPHLNIPLEVMPDEFLDAERRYIICANHGALFEIDSGRCVAGPCTGQALASAEFVENADGLFLKQQ